jgi:7,8-dihydropterin-6-yl-methyl-4-(beta-D-ribofuranosyl)aminobenzene 5'-phosphate synthase
MKITILCENEVSDIGFLAEWGFSAFIQTKDINILFDVGYSGVYKHNAKKIGVELENTDFIILSHFHNDHTRGLQFHNFKSHKKVVMHPQILEKLDQNESKKINSDFEVILSKKPFEFSKDIFYLGEIPRCNDFEKGVVEEDEMLDDSAIAIKTDKGIVVVSGCSHSGICNICEYAKKITNQKLYAVIGGFHLFEDDMPAVQGAIEYFKKERPSYLLPMHCMDFYTKNKFYNIFGCKKYSSGDVIDIEA